MDREIEIAPLTAVAAAIKRPPFTFTRVGSARSDAADRAAAC